MGSELQPWEGLDTFDYDVEGDYYDTLMTKESGRLKELGSSFLSSRWSRGKSKSEEARQVVYDLLNIQETVRSLIKIHGIIHGTSFGIASIKDVVGGAGASGFKNLREFKEPYILLDRSIYDDCKSTEVLDVYCGLGLHEASHINHTRKMFKRLESGVLCGRRKLWENLFEDERIEELIREESPGFGPYLQTAKVVLMLRKEVDVKFDDLSDMDKICFIIFTFIRIPEKLTDDMKLWKDLKGRCIHEELREMFPIMPITEDDVEEYGRLLEEFFKEEDGFYSDLGDKSSEDAVESLCGKDADKKSAMDVYKRISKSAAQRKVDEEANKILEDLKTSMGKVNESGADLELTDDSDYGEKSSMIDAVKRSLINVEEKIFKNRLGKRFGIPELENLVKRLSEVKGLSVEESGELSKASEERLEFGDQWEYSELNPLGCKRRTVIVHPKVTAALETKYKLGLSFVRNSVNRMRAVFRFRLGTHNYTETELLEGRLHKRMLGRASVSERLFSRSYTRVDKGLSLCLLLDESGSMGECDLNFRYSTRAVIVQKIAILIAEAVRKVPGIELEIYSYGSCGENDKDCLIKYLYGKENLRIESLAGYKGSFQNYDHIAIKTAGDLFLRNTINPNRMMLVMSDGAPAGYDYGGVKAEAITKRAVEDLEKKGITVINIAINAYKSERMFKHVIKFLDMNDLINKMRRLIVKIVKQVT